MTDRKTYVLTGGFVLIGLLCMGALIIMFGEYQGFLKTNYEIKAKFDRITGVREGTEVTLAGIGVGRVRRIELIDMEDPSQGVFVVLEIRTGYVVPRGSVANVYTPLMGSAAVNINPPLQAGDPLPKDGTAIISGLLRNPLEQVVDPQMMATLEKTTAQIGTLAEALTPAARAFEQILEQRTMAAVDATEAADDPLTANLSTTIERLHRVLKHFDTVLGDPAVQSNLKLSLENFRAASEQARLAAEGFAKFSEQAQAVAGDTRQVVGKVDQLVVTTHQRIDELGQKLILNTDQLSRLLDHAAAVAQQAAEGDGTIGMLLRDPKFYDELMLTTQRLGVAAAELQVLIKQWQSKGLLGM